MRSSIGNIKDLFAAPGGGETFRAFCIFVVLLVALLAIGGQLAIRQLSLSILSQRLNVGRVEALQIANAVVRMGQDGPRDIDYARLRRDRDRLRAFIRSRIAANPVIQTVEIRDRLGMRLVSVARNNSFAKLDRFGTSSLPALDQDLIKVDLVEPGPRPDGQIRLRLSEEGVREELESLRNSLWMKVVGAGVMALGVLVLGLLYVLHLVRKNRRLDQARQSAARASYVGLLASGLAHEIRNPLNAMNMNLQMLEEELALKPEAADAEHFEMLDGTKREIKRLERLVNNFLAYARPAQPRFEPCELAVVIGDVVQLLDVDFKQHGVELKVDLEPLLPKVELDEAQFKQALINLLVNARQVLGENGEVTIRSRAGVSGDVLVEVEDNGPGIPDDSRDRIFEVFYSKRGGGTGLGLPIARQVIERHGGSIEVDTVEQQGTTFRIRIPRKHGRVALAEAPA